MTQQYIGYLPKCIAKHKGLYHTFYVGSSGEVMKRLTIVDPYYIKDNKSIGISYGRFITFIDNKFLLCYPIMEKDNTVYYSEKLDIKVTNFKEFIKSYPNNYIIIRSTDGYVIYDILNRSCHRIINQNEEITCDNVFEYLSSKFSHYITSQYEDKVRFINEDVFQYINSKGMYLYSMKKKKKIFTETFESPTDKMECIYHVPVCDDKRIIFIDQEIEIYSLLDKNDRVYLDDSEKFRRQVQFYYKSEDEYHKTDILSKAEYLSAAKNGDKMATMWDMKTGKKITHSVSSDLNSISSYFLVTEAKWTNDTYLGTQMLEDNQTILRSFKYSKEEIERYVEEGNEYLRDKLRNKIPRPIIDIIYRFILNRRDDNYSIFSKEFISMINIVDEMKATGAFKWN